MTSPHSPYGADNLAPNNFGSNNSGPGYQAFDNIAYPHSHEEVNQPGKSGLALAAFIIGIVSLVSVLFLFPPLLLGPVGIIIAAIALSKGKKRAPENRRTWMSITGLVLAIISLAISIFMAVGIFVVLDESRIMECGDLSDGAAVEECINTRIEEWLSVETL